MVDRQNNPVTELPVLVCVKSSVIKKHIKIKMLPQQLFLTLSCLFQTVESTVKLMTEASTQVVNSIEKDGMVKHLQNQKKIHSLSQTKFCGSLDLRLSLKTLD